MRHLIISILTVTLFGLCCIQQVSAATTSITGHITTINLDSKQVTVESSNQTIILGVSKKQLKSLTHVDHDARYVAQYDNEKGVLINQRLDQKNNPFGLLIVIMAGTWLFFLLGGILFCGLQEMLMKKKTVN